MLIENQLETRDSLTRKRCMWFNLRRS